MVAHIRGTRQHRRIFQAAAAFLAVALGALSQGYPARAEDAAQSVPPAGDAVKKTGPAATGSGASESKTAMLKGEVHKIDLALESLQEVALDIKRVRQAAGDLYDEVTIKPASYTMPPNVVGSMVINIPVSINTAAMALPRAKWVDQCMNEVEPIIRLLKQDVDDVLSGEKEIHLPAPVWESLQPFFKEWVAIVSNLDQQLTQLKPYTKAPPFDNASIATLAGQIQADGRKLEITRKKIYKLLQKEARAAKKKEKEKGKGKGKGKRT